MNMTNNLTDDELHKFLVMLTTSLTGAVIIYNDLELPLTDDEINEVGPLYVALADRIRALAMNPDYSACQEETEVLFQLAELTTAIGNMVVAQEDESY